MGAPLKPGVLPQPLGHSDRLDASDLPSCRLISVLVKGTMVSAAELIADPAPQGPRLHESQMMASKGTLRPDAMAKGFLGILRISPLSSVFARSWSRKAGRVERTVRRTPPT